MRNLRYLPVLLVIGMLSFNSPLYAAEKYHLDPAHSFVQFRIPHLGYSMLLGRFNKLSGDFVFDAANPAASTISVTVDPNSVDSNHAKRDKHLRGSDFLDSKRYPQAHFVSRKITPQANEALLIEGELQLHGVTAPFSFTAKLVGAGPDPWGGYRRGYEATGRIKLADFGINFDLGKASREVELGLFVEGVRQ